MTLLGIDFLKYAGVIFNLAQSVWYSVDDLNKTNEYIKKPPAAILKLKTNNLLCGPAQTQSKKVYDELDTVKTLEWTKTEDYNVEELHELFEDAFSLIVQPPGLYAVHFNKLSKKLPTEQRKCVKL